MTTIKAIVNASPGHAAIQDVPYPKLANVYILVKPTAWAVNPDDVYHLDLEGDESCAGTHIGSDYAGVVVEVGPGVTKPFKKGDRVSGWIMGQNTLRPKDGSFADIIAVKGDVQMKIPDELSDTDAATQGIAIATIGQSFYQRLQLPLPLSKYPEPFTLFIYGGSTAMGIAGIQFAKLSGGTVVVTASPSNFEYLKSLGAGHVLDYKSATLAEDVKKIAGGPVRHVFDAYPSDASAAVAAAVLSTEGVARYVALLPGPEKEVKKLNSNVEAFAMLSYSNFGEPYLYEGERFEAVPEDFEHQKKFLGIVEGLFAQRQVKAPRVFLNRDGKGLQGLLHGLEQVRDNKVSGGKLVYTAE